MPRSELLRYIIGCKHRLQVAERRFLNLKDLERTFNLNDVTLGQVRDELKKPCYILAGKDKLGRAIIAFKIRHFKPKKADVSVMMKSVLTLADAMLSDIDTLRNGAIIVFDMKGLSRENFSFQLEKVFVKAFQVFSLFLPVRMSLLLTSVFCVYRTLIPFE